MSTQRLHRFKYFIDADLFGRRSLLFTSLGEALLRGNEYERINIIPAGHPHWRPRKHFEGCEPRPPSPIKYLSGRPWEVVRIAKFNDKDEPFEEWTAEFHHPADAFAFAEMKAKIEVQHSRPYYTWHVVLLAIAENGCSSELARMPADHLTQLRRAHERLEKRQERHRQRLAA